MRASYSEDALATLRGHGVTHLKIFCVGYSHRDRKPCFHWSTVPIETLIERHGGGAGLVMIARRATCSICKSRGAHVQPKLPDAVGTPGYDRDRKPIPGYW